MVGLLRFALQKLGFAQVKLVLDDGERSWQRNGSSLDPRDCHVERHEFQAEGMGLEFLAEKQLMEDNRFHHLVDLAAETWMKAVQKWKNLHQLPVRFSPDSSVTALPQAKSPGFSTAA